MKVSKETVSARKLWERILEIRFRTGEPYLNFIDTANRYLPQPLKDKGLEIHGSNLCNEYTYQQVLRELQYVVYHL